MNPAEFIVKWARVELAERAASQEHFIDLCRLLGQPTPAEHDATGAEFTFEKYTPVTGGASAGAAGDHGFADVWWKGKFAWEYKRKGKHKTLQDAYRQLCQYREALGNPPLLVVCDIARTEIHTNFTGTIKQIHTVNLEDLAKPESLSLLRRVFTDPQSFCPTITSQKVTEDIAEKIGAIAQSLHSQGHDPHTAAHFLMKCMFCLFAEDVGLLPEKLFSRLLEQWHDRPAALRDRMTELFDRMRTGGAFGTDAIPYFNGGLFDEAPALVLSHNDIAILTMAGKQDWSAVEPAIFGTLFERSLDPDKRAQIEIGVHYTSRQDILLVVEPVVMAPLRREWQAVKAEVQRQVERRSAAKTPKTRLRANEAIGHALLEFDQRLASVRILDPACGSGNFLYMAIQQLLCLEKEVIALGARPEIVQSILPRVRPTQLHGLEINPYAAELAQVVIWIGYLQWMRDNGFLYPTKPILETMQNIENRDAILDLSNPKLPVPAEWPQADFIIGNPPFLGGSMIWDGVGTEYRSAMWHAYELPKSSDLCCYWFERARQIIERKPQVRAGLLGTQGIRGETNRTVLERIKKTGDIFMAWSDRDWALDGAAVHISIVGFDGGIDRTRTLDGVACGEIFANLRSDIDLTLAKHLAQNENLAFSGTKKAGDFNITCSDAAFMLRSPTNPNSKRNMDVLRPWTNGGHLTGRWDGSWIIDFGTDLPLAEAALYERPFRQVEMHVKPARDKNKREARRTRWWLHAEVCRGMRDALRGKDRFIATARVSKFRLLGWLSKDFLPDDGVYIFARSDDYFFGVLHSAIHELWALRMGTQLEDRPRYTPTTCFETFPLPWPPGQEPAANPAWKRISQAAEELNAQRERWLNPPEWIDPIAKSVDLAEDFSDVPPEARPLIRQSMIMAIAAKEPRLKKRTLTNLYNERPTWLRLAHEALDRAVLAAYNAADPEGGWSEDWAEIWRDTGAGQPLPADHPLAARRAEIDGKVLANLLRLNLARAGG